VLRREELLEPVDGQLLDLINHLAPAVVPLPGIALGVLVGERRPHRVDDGAAGEVLAGDELGSVPLPIELPVDECCHYRVGVAERGVVVERHRVSWSILATRRAWRPPSNLLSSHVRRISTPSSSLRNRAGRTSTLASLCSRASLAISGAHATAARTPWCRLAAYDMPSPVPQSRTPRAASPSSTRDATACA